jgi:hypothetical protein
MKEVYKEVREQAEKAGEDALKDETCHGPCERAIFVDTRIKSIDFGRREEGSFDCEITGRWEAYILCYKFGHALPVVQQQLLNAGIRLAKIIDENL